MTHLAHRSQRANVGESSATTGVVLPPLRNVTGSAGIDLSER
jgi:hypothetical protein